MSVSTTQGILDKLVASKAGLFLGAPHECGGGHTFTTEIYKTRLEQNLASESWVMLTE